MLFKEYLRAKLRALWSPFSYAVDEKVSVVSLCGDICMPNLNSYTYMHNNKDPNDKPIETEIDTCNCRNKEFCPVPKSCQTKSIIYQANIDYHC